MLGIEFDRIFEVGVDGVHRISHRRPALDCAAVIIVRAGRKVTSRASSEGSWTRP